MVQLWTAERVARVAGVRVSLRAPLADRAFIAVGGAA